MSDANLLDAGAASAVAERCAAGTDETSCGNITGCSWSALQNKCAPKCATLDAGACKTEGYGCEWGSDNKCTPAGELEGTPATGCAAYGTASLCNAGEGCAWDPEDAKCYASCEKQSTRTACGQLRGADGAQRCMWSNGKCSKKVIAQCTPLWEDNSSTVGVVAGSSKMPMDTGQIVIISFVVIATVIVAVIAVINEIPATRRFFGIPAPAALMMGGGRRLPRLATKMAKFF